MKQTISLLLPFHGVSPHVITLKVCSCCLFVLRMCDVSGMLQVQLSSTGASQSVTCCTVPALPTSELSTYKHRNPLQLFSGPTAMFDAFLDLGARVESRDGRIDHRSQADRQALPVHLVLDRPAGHISIRLHCKGLTGHMGLQF